jgi:hypothetical protein
MVAVSAAQAQGVPTPVYPYPGDQSWFPMDRFWSVLNPLDYRAEITGARPYGGNGSLAVGVDGFWDWGFYGTLSGATPFGALGSVTAASMYWRRETVPQLNYTPVPNDPWLAQTPVLRLLLGDANGLLYGELVWEQFYTDNTATPYDQWVFDDMMTQNFWHNSGSGSIMTGPGGAFVSGYSGGTQYLVNQGCVDQTYPAAPPDQSETNWSGGLVVGQLGQWSDLAFCSSELLNSYVWGVAVGVGSRWPDQYEGYVDYVRLDFDDPTNDVNAVYANFELPMTPVPEPGTVALLATGLLGLGGAQWMRRRKMK